MRTFKLVLALSLAASTAAVILDDASAQGLRRARVRAEETPAKAAAETSAYQTNNPDSTGQSRQQSRQQEWQQASPNEQQTAKNVAKTDYNKKETNQADAKAAVQQKQATGRRRAR